MSNELLTYSEIQRVPGSDHGERVWSDEVDIGNGVSFQANLTITSKGNGVLTIGNLRLKIFDEHNNGAMYSGGLISVELKDMNQDNYKELYISGIATWHEEQTEEIKDTESFNFTYTSVPSTGEFKKRSQQASFNLEDGPQPNP